MSSEQIYYTYYSPTDWKHPNKVKYTENLSNAGDLLITSSSGFENLNARDVIARDELTSSWGAGIQKQNDFNYNVSVTNGFKFNSSMVNNIQVVSASSNIANTIAKQITIDDFDYDTIFGLTRANPNVIDYNWYKGEKGNKKQNIFGGGESITNKETTRIGPKLFLYKGTSNDYQIGNITTTIENNVPIDNGAYGTVINDGTYNNILKYKGQTIEWNGTSVGITNTTTFYKAEEAWPYKIQYNPNQWYHILTNGQKSALLTLPYWDPTLTDITVNDPERYYVLSVRNDGTPSKNPIYSYYKLDKIVENNYYYITSFFDTRPTIIDNNQLLFNSNSSSLFKENTIQVLPLISYNYDTFYILHDATIASGVASCVPLAYTTSREPTSPFVNGNIEVDNTTYAKNNFGLNPIEIKYEKNITITTTINYTIANMTNLSNILTGWNYLRKNFLNPEDNGYNNMHNTITARANLPYINAGIIIYIPTNGIEYTSDAANGKTKLNDNSVFIRFRNWLEAFGFGNFYSETTKQKGGGNSAPTPIFDEKFQNIYHTILTNSNILSTVPAMTQSDTDTDTNFFYKLSTPAFINFNANSDYVFPDYVYWDDFTADKLKYDFLNLHNNTDIKDTIKFVNTLCMPINNALNTTHTATDNFTFRLKKINKSTDYFYIIGIYFYITKGVPYNTLQEYPHYLGFSPSTNIAPSQLMTRDKSSGDYQYNGYLYPYKTINSFLCDSSNYTNSFNGTNFPYGTGNVKDQNALMKDTFITPSIYMTINESVGDV